MAWACSKSFHKNSKGSHDTSKEAAHQNNNLHRRHVDNGKVLEINRIGKRCHSVPSSKSRICNKLGKVSIDNLEKHIIPGDKNQLQRYDICNSIEENTVNSSTLSRNIRQSAYNPPKTGPNSGETYVICSSLYTRTSSGQISTEFTAGELEQQIIRDQGVSVTGSTFGASMVERVHGLIQLNRETHQDSTSRNDNNIKCIWGPSGGLESPLPRDIYRGSMVSRGTETTYKRI